LVSYPEDLTNDFQAKAGVITDTDVTNSLDGELAVEWARAVISNAAAGPGSTGGPIFNANGDFIGIHVGGSSTRLTPITSDGRPLLCAIISQDANAA
jgi:S1-C subfamily serine protease